ncbi:hypothetical protein [Sphingobium yanoikuyae]|uniref:hypothetical protein n=1 Tax=Sphingobium yanoikuyae TaxID=13690 RepID=UPI00138DD2F9|nr:hypothetical protein [Sphingobium yanoikuyae]
MIRWIVEARVEMGLSEATKFALRFEDDICEGKWVVAGRAEFKAGNMIGIFVMDDKGEPHCLVSGPVTRLRTSATIGGAGSWVEVHGEDKRAEMKAVAIQDVWLGKASAAADTILSGYGFATHCEETRIEYADDQHALPQRGTDLAFIEDIARKNNLEFWLTYTTSKGIAGPKLDEIKANLASSPGRAGASLTFPPPLTADAGLVIDVSPPPDQCVSVTKFEAHVDYDRPNAAKGFATSLSSGNPTDNDTEPPDPPVNPEAQMIAMLHRATRKALERTRWRGNVVRLSGGRHAEREGIQGWQRLPADRESRR